MKIIKYKLLQISVMRNVLYDKLAKTLGISSTDINVSDIEKITEKLHRYMEL